MLYHIFGKPSSISLATPRPSVHSSYNCVAYMVATKPFLSNKLISVPSKQLVTSVGTNHMALMQGQKHPIQRVMTEFTLLAQIKENVLIWGEVC